MSWSLLSGAVRRAMPPALRDALRGATRDRNVPISVHAAAFRGVPSAASVAMAIEIDGRPFAFFRKEPDGPFENRLLLNFFAINDHGDLVRNQSMKFDLRLSPECHHHATVFGLRINPRLSLPPGRYQLYVVALESEAHRTGIARFELEVPNFADDPLMLSGVVVTAASARLLYGMNPDEAMERLLPGPATSRRVFCQGDVLGIFVEAYTNTSEAAARIGMTTILLHADGQHVFRSTEPPHRATGGHNPGEERRYLVHVPLRTAPPGEYVLVVEARLEGGIAWPTRVCRSVPVTVCGEPAVALAVGGVGLGASLALGNKTVGHVV